MMKQALAIWVVGASLRLFLAFGLGRVETGWTEVQFIARSLLQRGEFADPYAIPTGPTSHSPPVYPAIQALIFAAVGEGPQAEDTRIAFSIVLAGLEYALLPWAAVRLGLGAWVGLAAGWGGALIPLHYWGESMGVFENTLSALLLLLFTGWVCGPPRGSGAVSKARAAGMGCFAGLLMLVSPTLLLPIAALACLAMSRGGVRRSSAAIATACALLVLSPWLLRNRVVFGGWSFVRGGLGLELDTANFDGASPDAQDNIGTQHFKRVHPFTSRLQCLRIRDVGERRFYGECLEEALDWIGRHQAEFATLATRRWVRSLIPHSQYWWHRAGLAAVLVLAAAGWLIGGRAALPLLAVTLAYSTLWLAFHTSIRYSHPTWWALCLSAGVAAKWAHAKLKSSP